MKYRVIGPKQPEGSYETFDEAAAATESKYEAGAPLEWSNPESGRHVLWYIHRDEGLKVDTHYRIIEEQ
ncbi:hypothetical protein [Streptomyces decoyicus]|uniref:hypothetical protein n=1 Tax=Streptomyces decoyicus TaxID=249567 RepID=UPI0038637F07